MAQDAQSGPANLRHDLLRSALEYAVRTAATWERKRLPRALPADLKPFLKHQRRLPSATLGRIRRIIEADAEFRAGVAEEVTPEQVDEVALEWLRREPGWEERVEALIERADAEAIGRELDRELARERKRRLAAEEATGRVGDELAALRNRLTGVEQDLTALRGEQAASAAELDALRRSIAEHKVLARNAEDRLAAARQRLQQVEAEREAERRRADVSERQRDELLASRAELAGAPPGTAHVAQLRDLAETARRLADQLGVLVGTGRRPRRAVEIPREAAKSHRSTAEFLLKVAGIVVVVDGYNVAKLAWPDLVLEQQRLRMLDAVDDLARRFGTEFVVVIDGADIVGAHTDRRRLARVTYSPPGVKADDVIREEVARLDSARPVAVVTNDREVRRGVIAAGGNVIPSDALVDVALRWSHHRESESRGGAGAEAATAAPRGGGSPRRE